MKAKRMINTIAVIGMIAVLFTGCGAASAGSTYQAGKHSFALPEGWTAEQTVLGKEGASLELCTVRREGEADLARPAMEIVCLPKTTKEVDVKGMSSDDTYGYIRARKLEPVEINGHKCQVVEQSVYSKGEDLKSKDDDMLMIGKQIIYLTAGEASYNVTIYTANAEKGVIKAEPNGLSWNQPEVLSVLESLTGTES